MRDSGSGANTAPALTRVTSRRLWVAGGLIVSLLCTVHGLFDPDFWWHLAMGRFITENGIPSHEPFAYSAAQFPWVGQQWLYEVGIYHLTLWGGAVLDMAVMGVVGSAAFLAAAFTGTRRGGVPGPLLAASIVINAFVAAQVMGVRGQVISVVGVALVVLILSRWRESDQRTTGWLRGERIVYLLPPIFLVWANLHAGFIAGLALIAVVAVLPRRPSWGINGSRKPLLIALVLSAAATLINPAGFGLYPYIGETFFNPTLVQNVDEWQSPSFHNTLFRLMELEVVVLVACWCLGDGPPQWCDVVLATGTLVATLDAQRNVALFAIVATPQLATYGAAAWERQRHRFGRLPRPLYAPSRSAALVAAGLLLLATAGGIASGLKPAFAGAATSTPAEYFGWPEAAADYVAVHFPTGRIYATFDDNGYLAYRFPTGRRILIYGETAVFGNAALENYLDIHNLAPQWYSEFEALHANHAILPLDDPDTAALHQVGWTVNCYDPKTQTVVMSAGGPVLPATASATFQPTDAPGCE